MSSHRKVEVHAQLKKCIRACDIRFSRDLAEVILAKISPALK